MENRTIEQEINNQEMEFEQEDHVPAARVNFDFLKAPTGEGSLAEYMDHPMNFNNGKGTARILRGFTGMLGSLNYAIVDIAIGLMEFMKGKPKNDSV